MERRPRRPRLEGALFLTDVVAENARARRLEIDRSQREVAELMTALGHPWTQATTSEFERGDRALTVDELAALAMVLGSTIHELLDFGDERREGLDYGHLKGAMGPRGARSWTRGLSRITVVGVDDDGTHFKLSPVRDRPGDEERS